MALTRFLAPLVPLALLAACGDDPEEGDGRSASGEVLEGTISDDMLPLDQLRSQPPLLEPERAPAARGDSAGEPDEAAAADEEETAPAEDDAAEEPQAEEEPQAAAE